VRRAIFVVALAAAPTAFLAWTGCSSSSNSGGALVKVNPGGTFGAEIHLTVVGRGRVTSDVRGIDCPGDCFVGLIFSDSSADGAAGGVKLKAITTSPTIRFDGWKFDTTTPLGTRGQGSDNCNPVTRPGSNPSVDSNATDIALPYGQVAGTPPAGQEGACSYATTVPLAYNITATFTDTDAGFDAGPKDLYALADPGGGPATNIGYHANSGKIYWTFGTGAQGIASISTSLATTQIPGTPQTVVPATTSIPRFGVDQNVVYQTGVGQLNVITTSGIPTSLTGAATCVGVASDFSNVYCRTSTGTLQQWSTTGVGPNQWYSGLPIAAGAGDIASDTSTFGYIYLIDDPGVAANAAIRRITKPSTFDGGPAVLQDVVTARTGINALRYGSVSSRLFWVEKDTLGDGTGTTAFASSLQTATSITAATVGLGAVAVDPSTSTYVWFASTGAVGSIMKAQTSLLSTVTCRTNIPGLGGIAVDSSYVYWTQSDGGVYRMLKSSCI
jgi:hypothetical protein